MYESTDNGNDTKCSQKNSSLRSTRDTLLPKLISGVDVFDLDIAIPEEAVA
jgi:hypothetical protein